MTRHHIAAAVLVAVTGPTITGCGSTGSTGSRGPSAAPTSPTAATPTTQPPTSDADQERFVKIRISIAGQEFGATLRDSAASRDLIAQLPQTLEMRDHGGVEKTGPLESPLSLDGQPSGADPDIGDVGYYAPGNDLVLYYGDQSYYDGIVVLGRLDGDAAARIGQLAGNVSARVTTSDR